MQRRRSMSGKYVFQIETSAVLMRVMLFALITVSGVAAVFFAEAHAHNRVWGDLGLAFIVSGVTGLFREAFVLRSESAELADQVAEVLYRKIEETPPMQSGLRAVTEIRRGYSGYYSWAVSGSHQDLFFAGRSVLHRIDSDFRVRNLGSAAQVLYRRLCEGAQIKVLFLDPSSSIVARVAKEENHPELALMGDLETSLAVSRELAELLASHEGEFPRTARLSVRVYDQVPYFAYHEEDGHVLVGFYFATAVGEESAAYEAIDDRTRLMFRNHFTILFNRPDTREILALSQRGPRYNGQLMDELMESVKERRTCLASDAL